MTDKKDKPLNAKQKLFCKLYIKNGWNATQAYMQAYHCKDIKTATASASRLLTCHNIQDYITELQKDIEKLVGINKIFIIEKLKEWLIATPTDVKQNWIKESEYQELTPQLKACIKCISTEFKTVTVRIKPEKLDNKGNVIKDAEYKTVQQPFVNVEFYDKSRAIAEINKMMGYYATEKVDINLNKIIIEHVHNSKEK